MQEIRKKLGPKNAVEASWIDCLVKTGLDFDLALTLTFAYQQDDRIRAERIFGVFMHYLNERCYRRAFSTESNRLKLAATLEGFGSNKRPHYHVAIVKPEYLSDKAFKKRVRFCWKKANKSKLAITDCEEYENTGWLEYICKELQLGNTDAISEHCYW
jgi:hypothetical protein